MQDNLEATTRNSEPGTPNSIGLIARSDNTGLGIQTHEFFRHIKPEKTLVIDVSKKNQLPLYPYRFPGARVVTDEFGLSDIIDFLEGLTVIFCCETPYNYDLFRLARNRGIKIVMQYNYEFLDMRNSDYPDVFAAPSTWHIMDVKKRFPNVLHLPVPVNRELLPFAEKKRFRRFLHIAGNTAVYDRNGTTAVIKAFASLNRTDIDLVVKCFNKMAANDLPKTKAPNINIVTQNTTNYEHNYVGFDALLMPRKYGGLCLPMQEALSCGMPVIMTDIAPNDQILPKEWLVPSISNTSFQSLQKIQVYQPDLKALAEKITWLADMPEAGCIEQSRKADNIAEGLDWKVWEQKYLELLNS